MDQQKPGTISSRNNQVYKLHFNLWSRRVFKSLILVKALSKECCQCVNSGIYQDRKKGKKMFLHKAVECKLCRYTTFYYTAIVLSILQYWSYISRNFMKIHQDEFSLAFLMTNIKCSSTALVQRFSAGNKSSTFPNFRSGDCNAEWKNTLLVLVLLPINEVDTINTVEEWLLSSHAEPCLISQQIVTRLSQSFNFSPDWPHGMFEETVLALTY